MVETMDGGIGLQVLQAVQALGTRMDKLETKVDGLGAEVRVLRTEVEGLRGEVGSLRDEVEGLRGEVGSLKGRMDKVEARVEELGTEVKRLGGRMDKQEEWFQRLGAEFIGLREDVRGELRQVRKELQDGLRQLKARIDLTDGTVVLMASALRQPRELGEELEQYLGMLAAR